jgi:hypothetical protein
MNAAGGGLPGVDFAGGDPRAVEFIDPGYLRWNREALSEIFATVAETRSEDRGWLFEWADVSADDAAGDARKAVGHVHPHFVCDSCGTVECLADVAVPSVLPRSAKLTSGYEVTKQEVTLHGVCPKCH